MIQHYLWHLLLFAVTCFSQFDLYLLSLNLESSVHCTVHFTDLPDNYTTIAILPV